MDARHSVEAGLRENGRREEKRREERVLEMLTCSFEQAHRDTRSIYRRVPRGTRSMYLTGTTRMSQYLSQVPAALSHLSATSGSALQPVPYWYMMPMHAAESTLPACAALLCQ